MMTKQRYFEDIKMIHTVKSSGQNIGIELKGRLTYTDYNNFKTVSDLFEKVEDEQCFLDLTDLEFIDSAGLGMLLLLRDKVSEKKGLVILKGAHGQVKKMLELGRFDSLFLIQS